MFDNVQEATILIAPSDLFVPPPSTQPKDDPPSKVDATGALVRSGSVSLPRYLICHVFKVPSARMQRFLSQLVATLVFNLPSPGFGDIAEFQLSLGNGIHLCPHNVLCNLCLLVLGAWIGQDKQLESREQTNSIQSRSDACLNQMAAMKW